MCAHSSSLQYAKSLLLEHPLLFALVTEAPRTLCALKTEVSIPALDKIDFIHLAKELVDSGLRGLTNKLNNLVTARLL